MRDVVAGIVALLLLLIVERTFARCARVSALRRPVPVGALIEQAGTVQRICASRLKRASRSGSSAGWSG
jgi:hypothetical protein